MGTYPLASSTWGEEEIQAMYEVINSGKFTMGEKVSRFEDRFAKEVGAKHAVMFNSGSSANLALLTYTLSLTTLFRSDRKSVV